MDYDKINDAIVNGSIKNIEDNLGLDTWATVRQITTDVVNNIASVRIDDNLEDDGLRAHHVALLWMKDKYPFLSHDAMIKIADTSAYFWKASQ